MSARDDDDLLEIHIRDLRLPFRIGVLAHEKLAPQPVLINVRLETDGRRRHGSDDIADYVSYADIVDGIRKLAEGSHVNLVETLAERICDLALADPRVLRVSAKVEKPAIIAEAAAVGVTVRRTRRAAA